MKKLIAGIIAHKIISILLSIIIIFVLVLFGLRWYNQNKKEVDDTVSDLVGETVTLEDLGYSVIESSGEVINAAGDIIGYLNGGRVIDESGNPVMTENNQEIIQQSTPEPTETTPPTPTPTPADSDLTVDGREEAEQQASEEQRAQELEAQKIAAEEQARIDAAIEAEQPTFGDEVLCWGRDGVPETMVDGSSVKQYLSEVSLSDFGSKWGSKLTNEDKLTEHMYLIGVDQNESDIAEGYSCESLGWLIDHLNVMKPYYCIKFSDLNTIGSLSDSHVALLCSYDWYSAFGMQDTLVVFEDISKTLKQSDFKPGTIFSAYVYVHNIKVKYVNRQRVVCIQYNSFNKHKKPKPEDNDPTKDLNESWGH